MEKIILASGSPRRKELLTQVGIPFDILVSDTKEVITKSSPTEIVEELSRQKAQSVAEKYPQRTVLGADTIVVLDGQVLGKPKDDKDAARMLRMLQGRTHQVCTGVTFMREGRVHSFHEKTDVTVYPMTEEEIEAYVRSGDPLDKAGAYGIQGSFAAYIEGIRGDYYNVVGLPVGRVYQELKAFRQDPVL